jgi:acyl carrier protein
MQDSSSTREKIIQHLLAASDAEIDAATITADSSLRDDLDLGSLQAVTLVMDLEDEFGVTVDDEEIEKLATVGDIFQLIESKQQDQ